MKQPITPELVREALGYITASLPRDDWARVGMAIKSEFDDDTGLALFEVWSATADGHDPAATRSTWRSIKAGGGVTIGTLLHMAKEGGFMPPKGAPAAAAPSADELARREGERTRQRAAEKAAADAAQECASADAVDMWRTASDTGASAYLQRKGVQGYGVRYAADGGLLVPLRDGDARLWNVQRIAPTKPAKGTDKLFIRGGRKAGLWHVLGTLNDADLVLVAEGYATGASVHEATTLPVVVAFDAGNLVRVVRALRRLLPTVRFVVCGDDDAATLARTGRNPGREAAESAAAAVGGRAVFPHGLPEGGSDFNDLHRHAGLLAVRDQVEAAIAAVQTSAPPAPPPPVVGTDRFTCQDSGVWFRGVDREGNATQPEWICSPLKVAALTRDQEGQGWGYLLQFTDPLGKPKQWAMPARMLAGDGGEYRAVLLNMGLRIATTATARNKLTQYIQTRSPGEFASCTDRIGWHGGAFVLPHETIGDDAERIVFQSENQIENTFRVKGDAAAWRDRVGALCAGNSRLVFAVACAFAGPLLRPAGMESGGFHLRGDSSSGKTTALRLAASVYGGPSYMQRWRTTDNALEAIAAQHCDSLLILDELAQVEGKVAGECAYMLANEQSKARATRNGAPRARLSWRLLFLSAGELGLADHMAEGMKRTRTGQEVRMADIPADAGAGLGAFESLHDFANGAAFASHLTRAAQACHGAPGRAFLEWVCERSSTIAKRVRTDAATLARQWVPQGASGQVERVAARFALVGVAGELATEAGLTGWPEGESTKGVQACFVAWLSARGGAGNGEVTAMLRQVRSFLESHGEGRFTWWHRGADDHNAKTLQRAGYRRMVGSDGKPIKSNADHQREYGERMHATDGEGVSVDYFILPETFRNEVCKGFDYQAVCRVLLEHGCLRPAYGRSFDCKQRLPGYDRGAWCYHVTGELFGLEL